MKPANTHMSNDKKKPKRSRRMRKALRQWRVRIVPLGRAVVGGALHVGRKRPRVSAVVVARNDGYFPDYEARLRATVMWNHARLADEVILVEWNPPAGAPLFATNLTRDFPFVKAYVVPENIHQQFAPPPHLCMLDYMAKNVGIRRATGDYICGSNIDICFDPCAAFIRFMLAPQFIYRTRRVDFHWDGNPIQAENLCRKAGHLPGPTGWRSNFFHGSGDFTLAHRDLWHRARGYDESIPLQRLHADSRGLMQLQAQGGIIVLWGHHYHTYHASSSTGAGKAIVPGAFNFMESLPYENGAAWGLGQAVEAPLSERVWQLSLP